MQTEAQKPCVVVIGGSYGGIAVINEINHSNIPLNIKLITQTSSFFMNHAAPRALVDKNFEKLTWIPYDNIFSNKKHSSETIIGKVNDLNKSTVFLESGRQLEFDYIVIATGSSYPAPFKFTCTVEDAFLEMALVRDRLEASSSVYIIGAGIVGIELAGEIATDFPLKKVTIISSGNDILSSTSYSDCLKSSIKTQLKSLKVELIFNERIKTDITHEKGYLLDQQTLQGSSGMSYEADIVFMAVGISSFNSSLLNGFIETNSVSRDDLLTSKGRIKVKKTGQFDIPGCEHMFSVGDVSNLDDQLLAFLARFQGILVGKNIVDMVRNNGSGGGLSSYKPLPFSFSVISLGRDGGTMQLPFGIALPSFFRCITKYLKSKNMFASSYWKNLHTKMPM